ncbi:S-adenosyl-L-methionine-dependent methyltransferase [Xylogone sp. PMI_703]|nr:S-adenosyl-L-methionine-dependent methyltransferase [Xylogone sp. PMI_703]
MAQSSHPSSYTQGYTDHTITTHLSRKPELDAAFLLPYIRKADHILDVGCGPGTITTGFAKYATEGTIVGIDISEAVLQKVKALATEANIPTEGPGSVVFQEGNILERLPYPDDTFDIVFACQVMGHMWPHAASLKALVEMRRVLKPGGILATRDATYQHFYPRRFILDQLWSQNQRKVIHKGIADDADAPGMMMPALFCSVGFDADGSKVRVGAGTTVYAGPQTREWLAQRAAGQLKPGDPFRQSWLDAGISEEEIQQTLAAVEEWAGGCLVCGAAV